jgi:ubiquinone/menaquinone biosynthesis C-methylase UbiE
MSLRQKLALNKSFIIENGIFYQAGLQRSNEFEHIYIQIREKEKRVYDDETLKRLPEVPTGHTLKREWNCRKASLRKLKKLLSSTKERMTVLELGCGNGWLTHNIASALNVDICGVDLNGIELRQAGRLFAENENLSFIYGDIFSVNLEHSFFDRIVVPSSIQYFKDLNLLILRLMELLRPTGEILIFDSPIYNSVNEAMLAADRSRIYFTSLGFQEMTDKYFHHIFQEVDKFNLKVLYHPSSFIAKLNRHILRISQPAFPFIQIKC